MFLEHLMNEMVCRSQQVSIIHEMDSDWFSWLEIDLIFIVFTYVMI